MCLRGAKGDPTRRKVAVKGGRPRIQAIEFPSADAISSPAGLPRSEHTTRPNLTEGHMPGKKKLHRARKAPYSKPPPLASLTHS